ncbi:MAG: four helix bundle protein [Bacteroidetes bacterium]|nr:four helix bundle protein [Bacteroidota bacterium]
MRQIGLEDRMVNYAASVLKMVDNLPKGFAANHLGKQLIRSGTAVALNYGEGQAAESRADFIHKLKIALKELKESQICLRILLTQNYLSEKILMPLIRETNELIAILITSINTAKKNQKNSK